MYGMEVFASQFSAQLSLLFSEVLVCIALTSPLILFFVWLFADSGNDDGKGDDNDDSGGGGGRGPRDKNDRPSPGGGGIELPAADPRVVAGARPFLIDSLRYPPAISIAAKHFVCRRNKIPLSARYIRLVKAN